MAGITIHYGNLESAADSAGRLAKELSSYSGELSSKVKKALATLPGNDSRGYISSASSQVEQKIRTLNNRASQFSTFASALENFGATARRADDRVAKSIKSTASSYVGERGWFESACDTLYNFLFVDLVNSNCVTRFLFDCGKYMWNRGEEVLSGVYNWFKYGDGRYVWNIIGAVVGTVAAIAGAVTAVAAFISGGCIAFLVVAAIGAVAAIVGAIITTVNSSVKVYNNVKALREDNPGVSRYLGNISGVSDAIKKYDLGDAEDNANWKTFGNVVDTTKITCDVLGIVTSVVNLGAVKSTITGRTTTYNFSKANIMKNFRVSLGFDVDKNQYTVLKGGSKSTVGRLVETFGGNSTKGWYANANGYGGFKWLMNRYTKTQTFINTFVNSSCVVNNTMKTVEGGDRVFSRLKSGLDFSSPQSAILDIGNLIVDTYDALGKFQPFGGINQYTVKPYKAYKDMGEMYYPELVGAN